jgi:hypothetical protein
VAEASYGTSPAEADTDHDGLNDGAEAAFWDEDWHADADGDGRINLLDADADNDGVIDGVERSQGTDPATPPSSPPPSAGFVQLQLEAEHGQLTQPMAVGADSTAAGGRYLWVPTGTGVNDSALGGAATYQFSVPVAGTYIVWGRVFSTSLSDNSFWVTIDSTPPLKWDTPPNAAWVWDGAHYGGGAPYRFPLSAGMHTLRISHREARTKLDQLVITNDPQFMPQ